MNDRDIKQALAEIDALAEQTMVMINDYLCKKLEEDGEASNPYTLASAMTMQPTPAPNDMAWDATTCRFAMGIMARYWWEHGEK